MSWNLFFFFNILGIRTFSEDRFSWVTSHGYWHPIHSQTWKKWLSVSLVGESVIHVLFVLSSLVVETVIYVLSVPVISSWTLPKRILNAKFWKQIHRTTCWRLLHIIYVLLNVIYEALCFDAAQGWMNGAPNETRNHSCRLLTITLSEVPSTYFLILHRCSRIMLLRINICL